MPDTYRYCAEALVEIFNRAMCDHILSKEFEAEFQAEFEVWSEDNDSIPFITWCANKINGGSLSASFPGIGSPPKTVQIMSPDGHTDWTLVAWWIRTEVDNTLTFSTDILQIIENKLTMENNLQLLKDRAENEYFQKYLRGYPYSIQKGRGEYDNIKEMLGTLRKIIADIENTLTPPHPA